MSKNKTHGDQIKHTLLTLIAQIVPITLECLVGGSANIQTEWALSTYS